MDVTDGVIEYKDWQDVNLTLEPNNRVSKPNEITGVSWNMLSVPEESGLSEIRTGNKTVNYTMTQPKLSTHADSNGTVTFTMLIKTLYKFDYGGLKGINTFTVPHTVTFKRLMKIPIQPCHKQKNQWQNYVHQAKCVWVTGLP